MRTRSALSQGLRLVFRLSCSSALARLLFAELIARRTDSAAARAWLGPLPGAATSSDPLLVAAIARVTARLR